MYQYFSGAPLFALLFYSGQGPCSRAYSSCISLPLLCSLRRKHGPSSPCRLPSIAHVMTAGLAQRKQAKERKTTCNATGGAPLSPKRVVLPAESWLYDGTRANITSTYALLVLVYHQPSDKCAACQYRDRLEEHAASPRDGQYLVLMPCHRDMPLAIT